MAKECFKLLNSTGKQVEISAQKDSNAVDRNNGRNNACMVKT
jgi:hypothetical protein